MPKRPGPPLPGHGRRRFVHVRPRAVSPERDDPPGGVCSELPVRAETSTCSTSGSVARTSPTTGRSSSSATRPTSRISCWSTSTRGTTAPISTVAPAKAYRCARCSGTRTCGATSATSSCSAGACRTPARWPRASRDRPLPTARPPNSPGAGRSSTPAAGCGPTSRRSWDRSSTRRSFSGSSPSSWGASTFPPMRAPSFGRGNRLWSSSRQRVPMWRGTAAGWRSPSTRPFCRWTQGSARKRPTSCGVSGARPRSRPTASIPDCRIGPCSRTAASAVSPASI